MSSFLMDSKKKDNDYVKEYEGKFKVGDLVRVNDRHRTFSGQIGSVLIVPRHPITWYTVSFSTGLNHKFRTSDLEPITYGSLSIAPLRSLPIQEDKVVTATLVLPATPLLDLKMSIVEQLPTAFRELQKYETLTIPLPMQAKVLESVPISTQSKVLESIPINDGDLLTDVSPIQQKHKCKRKKKRVVNKKVEPYFKITKENYVGTRVQIKKGGLHYDHVGIVRRGNNGYYDVEVCNANGKTIELKYRKWELEWLDFQQQPIREHKEKIHKVKDDDSEIPHHDFLENDTMEERSKEKQIYPIGTNVTFTSDDGLLFNGVIIDYKNTLYIIGDEYGFVHERYYNEFTSIEDQIKVVRAAEIINSFRFQSRS
jgi:hypothetical protein